MKKENYILNKISRKIIKSDLKSTASILLYQKRMPKTINNFLVEKTGNDK